MSEATYIHLYSLHIFIQNRDLCRHNYRRVITDLGLAEVINLSTHVLDLGLYLVLLFLDP